MGEWTWLHAQFPLADIALMRPPMAPRDANVLVRTIHSVPAPEGEGPLFEVRVAPHNVAPFRGGPWLHTFHQRDLEEPGEALADFRSKLAVVVEAAKEKGMP